MYNFVLMKMLYYNHNNIYRALTRMLRCIKFPEIGYAPPPNHCGVKFSPCSTAALLISIAARSKLPESKLSNEAGQCSPAFFKHCRLSLAGSSVILASLLTFIINDRSSFRVATRPSHCEVFFQVY